MGLRLQAKLVEEWGVLRAYITLMGQIGFICLKRNMQLSRDFVIMYDAFPLTVTVVISLIDTDVYLGIINMKDTILLTF